MKRKITSKSLKIYLSIKHGKVNTLRIQVSQLTLSIILKIAKVFSLSIEEQYLFIFSYSANI